MYIRLSKRKVCSFR